MYKFDLYYAFPQAISSNAATSSTTIRAFWGTVVTQNGTPSTTTVAGNTDCCKAADTSANCPGVTVPTTNAMITGRVVFKPTTGAASGSGFNTLTWNDDFLLASTY